MENLILLNHYNNFNFEINNREPNMEGGLGFPRSQLRSLSKQNSRVEHIPLAVWWISLGAWSLIQLSLTPSWRTPNK